MSDPDDRPLEPQRILDLLSHGTTAALVPEAILSRLALSRDQRLPLRRLLKELVATGQLVRTGRVYRLPVREEPRLGVFHGGFGRGGQVILDQGGPPVRIREHQRNGALDRDRVRVRLLPGPAWALRGMIQEVVSRERPLITGTFERHARTGWLVPDDPHLPDLLPILPEEEGGAEAGQAVAAEPLTADGHTRARVVRLLGEPGSARVEEAKLLLLFGLQDEFPTAVLHELEQKPWENSCIGDEEPRWDLTGVPLLTIDPSTARDHDDAIAVEELPDGRRRVIVAIADVAHYVRPGTALDREARDRGCSVYLPGRAIPMLPHALSSHLCSLVPGQERLVLGVELFADAEGRITPGQMGPARMRSRGRLTYEGVAEVLAGRSPPEEPATEHATMLRALERLARQLQRHRQQQGALELELPETQVVWDETLGRATAIERRARNWAHRLVEELMLATNLAVGARLLASGDGRSPVVWRVHEPPDPEEIMAVLALAGAMGVEVPPAGDLRQPATASRVLNRLLGRLDNHPAREVLAQRVLRALKQARYSTENLGHFGLAAHNYLHFTSPIRRYPDLVVHRLLRGEAWGSIEEARRIATHSSARERAAMSVELAAQALHGTLLLEDRIGQRLTGTVAAITRAGLFIQLDAPYVQGLLPMAALPADDYYELSDCGHELFGRNHGRTFRLGARLEVILAQASPIRRQLDFRLP